MEGKSGDAVEGARYPGCFSYDRLKALEKPQEGPSGCFVPEATWKESGGPAPFLDAPLTRAPPLGTRRGHGRRRAVGPSLCA